MAEPRKPVLSGGCQCGAVRYALYAWPERANICHCRMCQKAVGGPFAAFAPVRDADFAWTRGKPAQFASSNRAHWHFCAGCGTPLSFVYEHRDWIDVTIGSLDAPARVAPAVQFGIESKLPWMSAAALDSLPGRASEVTIDGHRVEVTNYQHPDHETEEGWGKGR